MVIALDRKTIVLCAVILLLVGTFAYMLWGGESVSDNRVGADKVRADIAETSRELGKAREAVADGKESQEISDKKITELEMRLDKAQISINQAQTSVENSLKSFNEYEKGAQSKIQSLERKNKLLEFIAGATVIWAAVK